MVSSFQGGRPKVWFISLLLAAAPVFGQGICPNEFRSNDLLLEELPHRQALEESGLRFEALYTGEVFSNLRGGLNTRDAVEWRDDWSLFLELDTETADLWEGGLFFVHLQTQSGTSITDRHVGDFQVLSNIDADDFSQVSEFWYQHLSPSGGAWVKFGKMEANADFAYIDFGCEFINSSAGFAPTIPLTTYPDQDWGVVVGLEPLEWFSVNLGVYQGEPDGGRAIGTTLDELENPMYMIEPSLHHTCCGLEGTLRFGWWRNETPGEEFDGDPFDDMSGWYVTMDQWLFKESPSDDEDDQGIGVFAQYGRAPEERWEAHQFYGAGFLCTGLVPERDDDMFGLYCGHVLLSDEPGAEFERDRETVLEMFYKYEVCPWCTIKPDLQCIIHPGGASNKTALALGLRTEIVF